jgi:hypothetical protein
MEFRDDRTVFRPLPEGVESFQNLMSKIVDELYLGHRPDAVFIVHTGGGCFALQILTDNGRSIVLTDTDSSALPDTVLGPWAVGLYGEDEDWSEPLFFDGRVHFAALFPLLRYLKDRT